MSGGAGLRGKSVSDDHSYVAKTHDNNDCPICNKEVFDTDRALCCCKCKKWKHSTCLKLSNNVFNVLSKQPSAMWFCPDNCIKEAEAVFSGPDSEKLTTLNSKVDLLLKSFSDFKLIQANQEEILDRKIEEKVKEVLQEQKEVERRKFNLLIFKAPEALEEASKEEEVHHDLLFMNDLLNELKIEATVSNVIRHGRRTKDKSRPMQISVPNAEVKNEILKNAKLLKKSEDENIKKVFISPDRTPKQRKELKAMIAEVIRRREDGENVALVNDKIKTFPARRVTGGFGLPGGPRPSED